MSHTIKYVHIIDEEDKVVSPQYPLPTDGDSLYAKDIWVEESIITNWCNEDGECVDENALIPVTGLHSIITNSTSDNPKILRIHFKRSINAHQVGIGTYGGGDFSNVKIKLVGSGHVERTVIDDSTNDTKYTSKNYPFEPQLFNYVQIEFHTTDTISVSNITIQKSINVGAQIYGLRADGTVGVVNVTNGDNLKISIEEFETGVSVNSNTQLKITQFDSSGNEVSIDSADNALTTIDQEHHEVHEGNHYFAGSYTTLGTSGVLDIIIVTPNTAIRMHYTAIVNSTAEMIAAFHEGVTETGDGAAVSIFNSDRNSSNTSTITMSTDPTTVSDTGTLLRAHSGGSTGPFAVGSAARSTSENILKQNTKYLIRITSNAADNIIDWEVIWYEI